MMLEAARWAPSSGNTQPWRFVIAERDTALHKRIFAHVAPHNQRWAGRASVLLVGAHLTVSPRGENLPYALYDLGQAIAHLSVQATALGLAVHQVAGFDKAGLHLALGLPADVAARVVVAIGRPGEEGDLPDDLRERERAPRNRHPLTALVLSEALAS